MVSTTADEKTTKYSYIYDAGIVSLSGGATGGYRKVTRQVDRDNIESGRTSTDYTDYFGNTTRRIDFGGRYYHYDYDNSGLLKRQKHYDSTSDTTPVPYIVYSHDSLGRTLTQTDYRMNTRATYGYDNKGNRTSELYQDISSTTYVSISNVVSTYDELGRLESTRDTVGGVGGDRYNISYQYDANSNVRSVSYTLRESYLSLSNQQVWYSYDALNRTIVMGRLDTSSNKIVLDTSDNALNRSVAFTYNSEGLRETATYGSTNHTEKYSYNRNNVLTKVEKQSAGSIVWLNVTERTLDGLDRVKVETTYKHNGLVDQTLSTEYDIYGNIYSQSRAGQTTIYYYNSDFTLQRTNTGSQSTTYDYEWWSSAQQKKITTSASTTGISNFYYDVNGNLRTVVDGSRTISYINNAQGQILQRKETVNGKTFYDQHYYVNNIKVGESSNSGNVDLNYVDSLYAAQNPVQPKDRRYRNAADFDQSISHVNTSYPNNAPTTHIVAAGETLQSIAGSLWGNANLWYLLADANGLRGTDKLSAGQVLIVPNQVTSNQNTSDTYKPYNASQAIGDTQPTLPAPPPPKKKRCAQIVMIIVAVVATVITAGAAVAVLAPAAATAGATLGALGTAALAGGTTASLSIGFGTAVAASVIGAAVGSAASQLAGKAMGVVDHFSWKAVGLSALTAGITAGVGGALTGVGATFGAGSNWAAVGNAAIKSAVSYGANYTANRLMGNNPSFSWRELGSSVVGGIVAAGVGAGIGDRLGAASDYATGLVSGNLSALMDDKWFGGSRPDYLQVSLSAIANTVADRLVDTFSTSRAGQAMQRGLMGFGEQIRGDGVDASGFNRKGLNVGLLNEHIGEGLNQAVEQMFTQAQDDGLRDISIPNAYAEFDSPDLGRAEDYGMRGFEDVMQSVQERYFGESLVAENRRPYPSFLEQLQNEISANNQRFNPNHIDVVKDWTPGPQMKPAEDPRTIDRREAKLQADISYFGGVPAGGLAQTTYRLGGSSEQVEGAAATGFNMVTAIPTATKPVTTVPRGRVRVSLEPEGVRFNGSVGANSVGVPNTNTASRGKISGHPGVIAQKYRAALDTSNPDALSSAAELRVAIHLRNQGEDIFFINNNLQRGAVGPGVSNDFTLTKSGTQADVKYLSGIGSNAAKNIAKGVLQVGDNGTVFVVRASSSKLTYEQFDQFLQGFKPRNSTVQIKLLDEADLPTLRGQ